MANFNTHLSVAIAASAGAAILATQIQLMPVADMPWMIVFGAIGGMLPDIDSGTSKPVKLFFTTLAVLTALAIFDVFNSMDPPYLVFIMATVAYAIVRYGLFALFDYFTDHRGVFHSLLTAVFFCLLMVCIACYFLRWDILYSWLTGLFIGFGFIVHLILDEVYSVDLMNKRMKKSFGTALKLYSYDDKQSSILMAICTLALVWITPQPQDAIKLWKTKAMQRPVVTVQVKPSKKINKK